MLNQDFKEFIQSRNDSQVRYLVVGEYAVALHGYPRFTNLADLENLEYVSLLCSSPMKSQHDNDMEPSG